MNINFKEVIIENFQSLKEGTVNLSKQGIILIKGENHYEKNSLSNGSGKSSVVESILWCLYGKTSSGISDPSNRYSNDGCSVSLFISIDEQDYTIIRSIKHSKYKTGLLLFKNNIDISDRIKTDTEKILKTIIPMNVDIFLSTIFLSQGFNNRFSALSPIERKERIEELTETSEQLENFKGLISRVKDRYNGKSISIKNDLSYNKGISDNTMNQIDDLLDLIEGNVKPEYNLEDIQQQITEIEKLKDNNYNKLNDNQNILYNLKNEINTLNNDIRNNKVIVEKNNNLINKINQPEKICPTCNQKISNEFAEGLIKDYSNELETSTSIIKENSKTLELKNNTIIDLQNEINHLKNCMDTNSLELKNLKEILSIIINYKDTKNEEIKVEELKLKYNDLVDKLDALKEDLNECDCLLQVANHIIVLISKQFRGYLLDTTINFMNAKLKDYSKMLFSNDSDIIQIIIDQSKINIFLGDSIYESLSGGEKRKVDLATMFTQRDLALNIAGTSSNLLIFDEIFDNLDEVAISIVLDMFLNLSLEIDSMFIISHKPLVEIPYDNLITVIKNEDRNAYLTFS